MLELLLAFVIGAVVGLGLLLPLLVQKFWPFPYPCSLLRPNRLPGCGAHWRGPGSSIYGAVVVVLVPVRIEPVSGC